MIDCNKVNEITIIFWDKGNIEDLKVYVNQNKVELQYPYTHRVAKSIIDYFGILLKEYPEDIMIIKEDEVNCENVNLKGKNFLICADNNYYSSIKLDEFKKMYPEIFRKVVKGVRLDVH